jgi:GNAT superfamily N-acetyltransferase
MTEIRHYKPENRPLLESLQEELQDHVVGLDPLKRLRRTADYGVVYIGNLLEKIREQNGAIFLAFQDQKEPSGFVAGIIREQDKVTQTETIPSRAGEVLELYVRNDARSTGIGGLLMDRIESYFKEKSCDVIFVDVFKPNNTAHLFYQHQGYADRLISMMKRL